MVSFIRCVHCYYLFYKTEIYSVIFSEWRLLNSEVIFYHSWSELSISKGS